MFLHSSLYRWLPGYERKLAGDLSAWGAAQLARTYATLVAPKCRAMDCAVVLVNTGAHGVTFAPWQSFGRGYWFYPGGWRQSILVVLGRCAAETQWCCGTALEAGNAG